MKRLWLAIALILPVSLLILGGCTKAEDPWASVEGGNLHVLVSFPPLYSFTRGVADKDVKVLSLLSATGPHEHEATATDAHIAAGADLFLVNGLTLDDFVTTVANNSANKKIKIVKVADKALSKKDRIRTGAGEEHVHKEGEPPHEHGEWDPHAWLGIDQAILMVGTIRDTLKEADAANAANYDRRAAAYIEKLKELQAYGKEKLKNVKNRKLIASHESLRYFCKSFDLELIDSMRPQPGIETDLKKLADLVKVCQEKDVRLIAIEPQFTGSKDAAQKLAQSVKSKGHDVTIVEIDPLETAPEDQLDADLYFRGMRKNLDTLAAKMQ